MWLYVRCIYSLIKIVVDLYDVERNVGVGLFGRVLIVFGIGIEEFGLISIELVERG